MKTDRLGEVRLNTLGQEMKIIEYFDSKNITVQVEGKIYTKKKYARDFLKGTIGTKVKFKNFRVGEVVYNSRGQKLELIAYRGVHDVDIKVDDSIILEHKDYKDLKDGLIRRTDFDHLEEMNSRLGEERLNHFGQKMKIIAYRTSKDIDVQFEDGTIVKNKSYKNFKLGNIANPNFNMNNFHGFQLKKMKFNSKYFNFTKNNVSYGIFTIQEFLKSELAVR